MAKKGVFPLALMLVLTVTGPAYAKVYIFSMLELAEKCDVVFVGKVLDVKEGIANVRIAEVLQGNLDADSVTVAPIYIEDCVGRYINFTAGEEVLVFGNRADGKQVTVLGSGQGKIKIEPKTKQMEIAAAKRLLEIAKLKDEDKKNEAMLAEVKSPNGRLRRESHQYIALRISHSELRQKYKDKFVALLKDPDPEVQVAALQGIRFIEAEDSIGHIVELTRSDNLYVVTAASLTLGQYDTPESTAGLIALTKHEDPRVRMRACIDLSNSRRPEAKEALVRLLDDKDPDVRAMAPRGLVLWLRRGEADDVLPRLEAMLIDPVLKVRVSAADKLGECRNTDAVPPLIVVLKQESVEWELERAAIGALYCHYSKGDAQAKALIDRDIHLIIAALKRGGPKDSFGPAFHAVGVLGLSDGPDAKAALRWAAESHPNEEVRNYAKRCLSTKE